jgi:hypothetical protein
MKGLFYHPKNKMTFAFYKDETNSDVWVGWSKPTKGDSFTKKVGRDEAVLKIVETKPKESVLYIGIDMVTNNNFIRDNTTFVVAENLKFYIEKAARYFKDVKKFNLITKTGDYIVVEL